jgi:hypothetical protein
MPIHHLLSLIGLLMLPSVALATETAASSLEAQSWDQRFETTYDALVRGDFPSAVQGFQELLEAAPDAAKEQRVRTLLDLAKAWSARGYTFVLQSDAAESMRARVDRRRTTGEIAGLYVDSVLYGLGTGAWVASLAEADSAAGVILPALLFAGGSAGSVYLMDQPSLGYGVARSASAGLKIGLLEGVSWVIWNEARPDSSLDYKINSSLIWGLSTVGMIGGGFLGHHLGATPGAASMVESGATWTGLSTGLLAYGLFGDSVNSDTFFLASAIGLNLGAVGAGFLAGSAAPSVARVRYLDLGGLSGGLLFGGLFTAFSDMADARSSQLASLLTALGVGTGITTAWVLTKDMSKDIFVERETVSWVPTILPSESGLTLGAAGNF